MKWKTWIGEGFNEIPIDQRLLIIGESNYDEASNRESFVIENVEDATNGQEYKRSNFFKYTAQCLTGNKDPDMSILNKVAYNVIVQRPLESSGHRPKPSDFRDGWNSLFEEIKRLKISNCLFIGVGAANHFNYVCHRKYNKGEYGLKRLGKIKGCRPRVGFIKNDEFEAEFTFIRHAGRGGHKYWSDWNGFLTTQGFNY